MEKCGFYKPPSAGSRIPVEFTVEESGKVDLYFERNQYKRIGDLARPMG